MDNKTTKRDFVIAIDEANDIIESQDALIAELRAELGVKPTAAASLAETPSPAPVEASKLTGLARAIAANAKLQGRTQ
jgi:hypothetical protein